MLTDLTSRDAVLAAIEEFERVGREAFLRQHGFGPARDYFVRYNGRLYDSKAVAGVAHGYQWRERGPLPASEFSGGDATVRRQLEALGFEVVGPGEAPKPAPELFVFVAGGSTAQQHFERSIEAPVPVSEVAAHEPAAAATLRNLEFEEVRCWGSTPGPQNLRSWERMQPGHFGLLSIGAGRFPVALPVIYKLRSSALAGHLWGRDEPNGQSYELMFFFGEPRDVDLDIEAVRAALAYDDAWWPRGLQYPAEEQQQALLDRFGSVAAFVSGSLDESEPPRGGAAPTAEELLVGGVFTGPPEQPPRPPERRAEYDPDRSGRGHMAHEQTVAKLEAHVGPTFRKGTRGINHDGVWKVGEQFHIVEVKSITTRNEVGQLQKGLGQILHNRFKARRHGIVVKGYLVAEKEPANSRLWRDLCTASGIVFSWPARFSDDVPPGTTPDY